MTIKPGQAALRRGRVSEPGRIYIVTCVAWNRSPAFRHYLHARMAARIIHERKTWGDAECMAWVLMPDHWHGLVRVGDEDLSKVIHRLKSRIAKAFRKDGRQSPLWQKGFHDRALRAEDDVRAAARYIVANPVRAGIVERAGQYPYWNAVWL
ncbi:REP-associated tyrosine transposase [Luteibacter aegosomatissinici]|uniref:REP-associated tyrosine transposase n=1 Tax=Luteibacter aegosomatissinici TaxID=2911539 RepID=UPI001FFAF556|nr:transposase [Luteibacter aegosomatissinici]UPG96758.1 transposase [Luteibacter aegosomatissinici]